MPVSIRKASFEDLKAILDLWDEMMEEHQRQDARIHLTGGALAAYRAYVSYHMASSDACVMVAEDAEDGIIGFCLMVINRNLPMFEPERYGYLSDLTVSRRWRRRGIGRALVGEVRTWLRQRRIDSIQLQYYDHNDTGGAFWRAMNFKPFYTRMWLDIV